MENHVFAAVLIAAFLHAGWNSVVKVGLDRVSTVLLLALVQAVIALLLLPFVTQPAKEAWPWIIAAAALHTGYKLFLVQAYAHSDLSQAYPLARGSAPLIVTLFSVAFLGVSFDLISLTAILAISLGILLMALRGSAAGRMRGKALFYAIGTAAFTASYTLVDGIGARIAGTSSGFILWMVLGDAVWGLSNVLTVEGRKYGIRIWTLAPGALTRMTEDVPRYKAAPEKALSPEGIAPAVLYMVSDLSGEQTGKTLGVSGARGVRELKMMEMEGWNPPGDGWTAQDMLTHADEIFFEEDHSCEV